MYIFAGLYYVTGHGTDIKIAQYIFAALYILTLVCVFMIYQKTASVSIICQNYFLFICFLFVLFKSPLSVFVNDKFSESYEANQLL